MHLEGETNKILDAEKIRIDVELSCHIHMACRGLGGKQKQQINSELGEATANVMYSKYLSPFRIT